jgi:RNA polymerase sigma-70 factor, ECF subfamily
MDPATEAFLSYRRTGDLDALGRTFDLVAPRLLALALHLCGSAHDAEDALQATFVIAMQKHTAFDARQPVGPWLAGILAGEARNLLRRERRRRGEPLPADAANGDAAAVEADPTAVAGQRELVARLRTHIEALPAEQRQVLLLQLQYGLQPAEIAEVLGIAPGAVRMRLHRGLQALRAVLPAGLAAALAPSLAAQALPVAGLQQLRHLVLQQARIGGPLTVAAGTGVTVAVVAGGLGMKKLLCALVVGFVLFGVWQWLEPGATGAVGAGEPGPAVVATSALQGPSALAANEPAPAGAERVAAEFGVDQGTGALRIRVLGDEVRPIPGGEEVTSSEGSGTPLAAILVELMPVDLRHGVRRVVTDADGSAIVAGLPSGDWNVRTSQRSEGGVHRECRVIAAKEVAVELHMAVLSLRGCVVDPTGRPVGGADVWVGRQFHDGATNLQPQSPVRRATTTAADGTFALVHLRSEEWVGARKDGFASSWAQPMFALPGAVTLMLEPRPASLRVVVTTTEGPLPDDLLVLAVRDGGERRRSAIGDWIEPPLPVAGQRLHDGVFEVYGLVPGVHTATVLSRGILSDGRVMVAPDRLTEVKLVLQTGMEVRGRIVGADRDPKTGLYVCMLLEGGSSRPTMVGEDGGFVFPHCKRAPVVLQVGRLGSPRGHTEHRLEPPARGDLQCELVFDEPASLIGRLEGPAGASLGGWIVGFRAESDGREWGVTADQNGSFELHGVGAAAGTLSFERAFGGITSSRFELRRTGTEPSPWVIPVPADCVPNASLRGRVVDARGQPVPEAVVSVDEEPPLSVDAAMFTAAGLDAGPHQLRIAAPGHVVLRRQIELSAGQQLDLGDVALTTGCELRVRFLRPDGSPWRERAPIPQLRNSAGESIYDRVIEADADGTVVMRGLPAGRCRVVRIEQDELLFEAFDVELRPEAATECTVATSLGRHCELVLGDPDAIPEGIPLEFVVHRADGVVLSSQNVQRKGARLLPQDIGLGDPFRCTLPLEALRAELCGPAGISHALEFAVRVEQESPIRLVVPQRR